MAETVIKIENLSKHYKLGLVGTGSLSHDLKRRWHLMLGKEDPFLKLGEENIRESKGTSDYVWALKDINFEVQKGEVLGIIGKNGAGKSTLLKILSRVTTPTTGEFKVKGRIASLLEVGTGFHPELTGRENTFLNGAILGMSKAEIRKKFDEIVAFSGVERYIDTPVKRYSSGMYVRLAFAVAAHLDPEILIIDEVLSVGDAEFQKKCLGKMKDVAGEGRTVIFVSHNMEAVKKLCTRVLYLKHGHSIEIGDTKTIINRYLGDLADETKVDYQINSTERIWENEQRPGNSNVKINRLSLKDMNDCRIGAVELSKSFKAEIEYEIINDNSKVFFSFTLMQDVMELLSSLNNKEPHFYGKPMKKGTYVSEVIMPGNLLNKGTFQIWLTGFSADNTEPTNWTDAFNIENIISFDAIEDGVLKGDYYGEYGGFFRPKLEWKTRQIPF
jgi:lipopolysaccharide transport system ATP-binding protein